jgi:1-phosphofructokinase
MSVLTVTLNPAIDMRMRFAQVQPEHLNRAQDVQLEPSGKGINVARALHRQGFDVTALALLGGPFGAMLEQMVLEAARLEQDRIKALLERHASIRPMISGLRLLRVSIAGETRCNVKALNLERAAVTELNAPGPKVSESELQALRHSLQHELKAGDLVVFSGSLPTGVPATTYADLMGQVSGLGGLNFFDADGAALKAGLKAKPFLIKPNRVEAESLLNMTIQSPAEMLEAARRFQALGAQHVVLSLGAEGALFAAPEQTVFAQPPLVNVHSTVGSGDALLSGLIAAKLQNLPWPEAARYATAVAAARVASESLEFPSESEIQTLLDQVQVRTVQ